MFTLIITNLTNADAALSSSQGEGYKLFIKELLTCRGGVSLGERVK